MDLGIELGCFALPDQVGGGWGVDQNFLGHHPPELAGGWVGALTQGLGEHGQQAVAQLYPDLGLLAGGEHIHHPIHGLGGRAGVQGAKHQVPGFGCADGQLDGFEIAHFAHQDHVRVLA